MEQTVSLTGGVVGLMACALLSIVFALWALTYVTRTRLDRIASILDSRQQYQDVRGYFAADSLENSQTHLPPRQQLPLHADGRVDTLQD